jgi:hypothetical protein
MTQPSSDPPRKKPPKPKSKNKRWAEHASAALKVISEMSDKLDDLESATSELRSVQEEYEEWRDNMGDNLRSSPTGEKLEEVCNLNIEDIASELRSAIEEAQTVIEEAESIELPLGWGRD